MKSSIDRAGEPAQPRVPRNREFSSGRAGRKGRQALQAREVFTLMDAALVPRERRLFSTGEDPISGPVARFISSTPDRDVQAPARAGKEKDWGAIWLAQDALCSYPTRACCPSCHGAFEVPPFPSLSLKPQLQEETLPGPSRVAAASQGSLLWEKQGPYPPSICSLSRISWARGVKGLPAPRSHGRAG